MTKGGGILEKPAYKKIYAMMSDGGSVRLGEVGRNGIEVEDETGSIRALILQMDGQKTVEEIHSALCKDYPELSVAEVSEAVKDLEELGFVYDTAEDRKWLTKDQQLRFKGNLNLFADYAIPGQSPAELQARLLNANVTILGMGAFGSSLLFNLAGLGVRKVRIVDFDTVELSNLNRQMLFHEGDLGRPKIEVAKEFIGRFYSDMQLEAIPLEIRTEQDVERVIEGSDLVVVAADQPFVVLPRLINKSCVKLGIPFISGGINLDRCVHSFVIPGQTGCLDCMHLNVYEQAPEYYNWVKGVLEAEFPMPNMAIAPSLQAVTGLMAAEIMRYLTGIGELRAAGRMVELNIMSAEIVYKNEWKRNESLCPTCGTGDGKHPFFELVENQVYAERSVVRR